MKDKRPVEAIKSSIQKTFRKSKQYKVKNDNQVIDYINENKIDLKNCDINCFKNIGFNNELDYLVTGKVKKTGTNWNLAISIIDVKTSAEPVLIAIKSKGPMKLISKLEKKLNKYILKIVEENKTTFRSSEDLAVKPIEEETIYYNVPIYVDQKCGYYYKADFINANVEKNWDGTFHHIGDNWNKKTPLNGTFLEWYSDTIMKNEIIFEDGILKKFNHWDRDGNQLIIDGNGYYKEYWYDDVVLMEGKIKNGTLDGDWKFYYGGGTSWPKSIYYKDSETGKIVNSGEINLPENAILIGEEINENWTYPLKLKPESKNQLIAIVEYKENPAPINPTGHENWLDFIPIGTNHRWYNINGELMQGVK